MHVSRSTKTGLTSIKLSWIETRQIASGAGLDELRRAVGRVVEMTTNEETSETDKIK